MSGTEPESALAALAHALREDDSVISPHVKESQASPALGLLAAAGPRATAAATEYALLVETIREGYLLHYGAGRVVQPDDPDLALLAGDYLYALGLERLAALGDLEAVRELADLISLSAQVHAGDRDLAAAAPLWLASVTAVSAGPGEAHEPAKHALREGLADAPARLWEAARSEAAATGISEPLDRAAEAIGFAPAEA